MFYHPGLDDAFANGVIRKLSVVLDHDESSALVVVEVVRGVHRVSRTVDRWLFRLFGAAGASRGLPRIMFRNNNLLRAVQHGVVCASNFTCHVR